MDILGRAVNCWGYCPTLGKTRPLQMSISISGIMGLMLIIVCSQFDILNEGGSSGLSKISKDFLIAIAAETIATIIYCIPQSCMVCATCTRNKALVYCWTASRIVLLTTWFMVVVFEKKYYYDVSKTDCTMNLVALLIYKTGLELYFVMIVYGLYHELNEDPCKDETELDEVVICDPD